MKDYVVLESVEITRFLEEFPNWKVLDGYLVSIFVFASFKDAIAFVNIVAGESEALNHHPEWTNIYKKVEIKLSTYEVGNRITDLDIRLATFISKAYLTLGKK